GADNTNPTERTVAGREMPRGGNTAGRGVESTDAAEKSGGADGTAARTADSAERTTRRGSCSFAPPGGRPPTSAVPGVAGGGGEAIVGFVGHEEFGSAGVAEEDGSGDAEALDDRRGVCGSFCCAQERTGGIREACDFDTTFDGDRNAVKRTEPVVAREFFGGGFCGGAGGIAVEMDEGIELRLERGDASEFVLEEFERRKLFGAEEFRDLGKGKVVK